MGRYDKIKVWNGSAWVQPSRIRVRANNSWQDFGDNLSDVAIDNSREMVKLADIKKKEIKNEFI